MGDGKKMIKTVVISGINLFEGGPLSIYYDLLDSICSLGYDKKYKIIAFVHKINLFQFDKYKNIIFIEFYSRFPVLTHISAFNSASQRLSHQLMSIANTKYRYA